MSEYTINVYYNVEFANEDAYDGDFDIVIDKSPEGMNSYQLLNCCEDKIRDMLTDTSWGAVPDMFEIDIIGFEVLSMFGEGVYLAETIFYPEDEDVKPETASYFIELSIED